MPRNGSNVYSPPAGTLATTLTTISSPAYNAFVNDLTADANLARPIVAGGHGATTAVAGGDNLSTKGADIASAATTDIGAATGRYVHITGTTTITSFGTKTAGVVRILTFDGILTLTHNATSLILPTAANILTAAGDVAVFVSEGGGNWRCASYNRASGEAPIGARVLPGHIYGLTLSNNATDATNDIDIAVGSAASDAASPVLITLASAITKRLDAAWAVGTGNGGLDTGSIANTTYHVWLIQRSDTGVVDAVLSASATSPTMPTNYDRKRRIGAILREGGVIVPFSQNGDEFLRVTPAQDIAVGIGVTTAVLATLSVPAGIKVIARLRAAFSNSTTLVGSGILVTSPDESDRVPAAVAGDVDAIAQVVSISFTFNKDIRVNTSRQIRYRSGNTTSGLNATTYGWIDTRGKLG